MIQLSPTDIITLSVLLIGFRGTSRIGCNGINRSRVEAGRWHCELRRSKLSPRLPFLRRLIFGPGRSAICPRPRPLVASSCAVGARWSLPRLRLIKLRSGDVYTNRHACSPAGRPPRGPGPARPCTARHGRTYSSTVCYQRPGLLQLRTRAVLLPAVCVRTELGIERVQACTR